MSKPFTVDQVAAICHAANRELCLALGDRSQPDWRAAPQWQKSSALDGVRFHLDNPDARPDEAHENWLRGKIDEGWVYGPKKDPDAKTHPCVLPFHQLPPQQQAKDHLFRAIVHGLAPFIDRST